MSLVMFLWLVVAAAAVVTTAVELGCFGAPQFSTVSLGVGALSLWGAWSVPASALEGSWELLWVGVAAAAVLLGAVQSARCYLGEAHFPQAQAKVARVSLILLALLVAMAAFPLAMIQEPRFVPLLGGGILMLTAFLTVRFKRQDGVDVLSFLRYSGALPLLWAGAFLVYLQVAPRPLPVSIEAISAPSGEAQTTNRSVQEIGAMGLLSAAALYGFLRKRRG